MYQDPQEQEPEEGFLTSLGLAIPRSIAGAASGVANLFGADVKDNFGLGHSQGFIPGLVEGVAQFALGFVPVAGVLGKVGAFAKYGKYASALRGVAAGAAADFTVFDGNDPRLSNLIQSVPALQNPLTEFLASDPKDDVITGRLKNVLEGAGLGLVTDGLLHMFKGMRRANSLSAAGDHGSAKAAAEDVTRAADSLISEPTPVELAREKLSDPVEAAKPRPEELDNLNVDQVRKEFEAKANTAPQEPLPETITKDELASKAGLNPSGDIVVTQGKGNVGIAGFDKFVREPYSRVTVTQLKEDAKTLNGRSGEATKLVGRRPPDVPIKEWEKHIAEEAKKAGYDAVSFPIGGGRRETHILSEAAVEKRIVVDPTDGKNFFDVLEQRKATDIPKVLLNSREESLARNLDITPDKFQELKDVWAAHSDNPEEAAKAAAGVINYAKLGSRQQAAFTQTLVEVLGPTIKKDPSQTWEQQFERAAQEFARISNQDPYVVVKRLSQATSNVEDAAKLAAASRVDIMVKAQAIQDLSVSFGKVSDAAGQRAIMHQIALIAEPILLQIEATGRLGSAFGRGLNLFKASASQMDASTVFTNIRKNVSESLVRKQIKEIAANAHLGPEWVLQQITTPTRSGRIMAAGLDYYYFSLLSAARTLTTNFIGAVSTGLYLPMERKLGAWVAGKLLDPSRAAAFERELNKSTQQMQIASSAFMDLIGLRAKTEGSVAGVAARATKESFKTGQPVLGPGPGSFDARPAGLDVANIEAITGKQIDKNSVGGKFLNTMIEVTKLPGRVLTATDEMVRQVFTQAHYKSEMIQQANENGLRGQAAKDWVEAEMAKTFRNGQLQTEDVLRKHASEVLYPPGGRVDEANRLQHIEEWVSQQLAGDGVKDRSMHIKNAWDAGLEATFQTPLDTKRGILSDFGSALQSLKERHPVVTLFAPFIKTPLNILTFAANRAPIPGLNKDFIPVAQYLLSKVGIMPERLGGASNKFVQEFMGADVEKAAEAVGRATAAVGMIGAFGTLAASGVITGRGPNDLEQQKVLKATGWQPYSIKVGDAYVSYQRFDPFASILSFYADWGDVARFSEDSDGIEAIALGAFSATVTNLQSKSYLAGITDLFKLLADPVGQFPKFAGRLAGAAVPNAIAAGRDFTDEFIPDLNGIMDHVTSRIPMMSNGMDKQRNILGEPLNRSSFKGVLGASEGIVSYLLPVQVSTTSSDVVTQELANLAYPFTTPKPMRMGVDLRDYKNERGQSAYDRWQELTSQVSVGGRTIRSTLERLIKSDRYQAFPRESIDKLGLDSPQVSLIKSTVSRFQREAERQMLAEFPEIRQLTRDRRALQQAANAGNDPVGISSLLGGGR